MIIEISDDLKVYEYNNLRNSVGWDSKDENLVQDAIKNSTIVKKAIIDNQTIGMARVMGDGIYYFIVDVVVDSRYQGKGIGKRLIDEIVNEIDKKTKTGQSCSINLMSMNGKEKFYETCGFIKVPFGHTGYGMIRRIEK